MMKWEYPDLSFLVCLENGKENHQKNKDFLSWASPSTVGRAIGKTDVPLFQAIPETNRKVQQYSATALFILSKPLKSLGKNGKKTQKIKEFPAKEKPCKRKSKEFQKRWLRPVVRVAPRMPCSSQRAFSYWGHT